MARGDFSSFLFRFRDRDEQLLLALAIYEDIAPAVTAYDLLWWLREDAVHPNLDCQWRSDRELIGALRGLRRERLVSGSINCAIHDTSMAWGLREAGWQRLGARVLFKPEQRRAA